MVRKFLLLIVGLVVFGATSASAAFPPIDLTFLGASVTDGDGVIWNQLATAPTGTGVYNPFLRVQQNGMEEGFNTDWGGPYDPVGSHTPPLDDKGGVWTHNLQLNQLAVKTVGSTDYYQFTLDINEPNNYPQSYLSLDELRIYTSATGSYDTYAHMTGGSTLRYNMDGSGDQTVYLDHQLVEGSGHDDMEVLIPVSFFGAANPSDFLYLYCKFGATTGMEADVQAQDGFEEWSALLGQSYPPPPAAEPSTMLLLGGGLVGLLAARNRKK